MRREKGDLTLPVEKREARGKKGETSNHRPATGDQRSETSNNAKGAEQMIHLMLLILHTASSVSVLYLLDPSSYSNSARGPHMWVSG